MLRCCIWIILGVEIGHFQQVSYVNGEGVGLTVHKESVLLGEIKKVELRSRISEI